MKKNTLILISILVCFIIIIFLFGQYAKKSEKSTRAINFLDKVSATPYAQNPNIVEPDITVGKVETLQKANDKDHYLIENNLVSFIVPKQWVLTKTYLKGSKCIYVCPVTDWMDGKDEVIQAFSVGNSESLNTGYQTKDDELPTSPSEFIETLIIKTDKTLNDIKSYVETKEMGGDVKPYFTSINGTHTLIYFEIGVGDGWFAVMKNKEYVLEFYLASAQKNTLANSPEYKIIQTATLK